jgi:hypothetical protein
MLRPEVVPFLYVLLAVVSLTIFYFIVKGAVRSGTKDIVEELRKNRPNSTDP